MTTPERWLALSKSIDETIEGLTSFDAEGLQALEQRVRAVTAEYLAHGSTDGQEMLPDLLRKHALLRAVLAATASNLKVMESAFDVRCTRVNDGRFEDYGYTNRIAEPGQERSAH